MLIDQLLNFSIDEIIDGDGGVLEKGCVKYQA